MPIGRTTVPAKVANIGAVPGIIGKKRMADLEKAVRNRNARMRYQTKKLSGEYTYEKYVKLARAQYLPPVVRVDASKITSVKEYNALIRMLNADKTGEWKHNRLQAMRRWMRNSIARSIWVDEDMDPELFDRISKMSESEILRYREQNKDLIKDIFDEYEESAIDVDDRNDIWRRIRVALGLSPELPASSDFISV